MNTVLDTLCSDHANFGKLLNVIAQQAQLVADADAPDFEILNTALAYLEGYPSLYHHPVENVLCERLEKNAPSAIQTVETIMREHAEIRSRLTRFKELITSAEQGSTIARSTIVDAANTFVESEWAHMERERTELFPLTLDAFQAADWSFVEGYLASNDDTLFGRVLTAPFQRLHQLLLEASTKEEAAGVLNEAVA